jgi:hypothetical protein
VAPRTGFYPGDAVEFTVIPQHMAGIALGESGFFAVGFMLECQRLFAPDVERARESGPTGHQCQ